MLVTVAVALPGTSVWARQTMPGPRPKAQLVKVGVYPTQVTATVRSIRLARVPGNKLNTDTVYVLKLRIHNTRALTTQGTTITDNESMEVVATSPFDASLIGKTVSAQIERSAESDRERWFLTDIFSPERQVTTSSTSAGVAQSTN